MAISSSSACSRPLTPFNRLCGANTGAACFTSQARADPDTSLRSSAPLAAFGGMVAHIGMIASINSASPAILRMWSSWSCGSTSAPITKQFAGMRPASFFASADVRPTLFVTRSETEMTQQPTPECGPRQKHEGHHHDQEGQDDTNEHVLQIGVACRLRKTFQQPLRSTSALRLWPARKRPTS